MFQVIISKDAENDLKKSCEWYDLQQAGLSNKFLKAFFYTLKFIEANPLIYQIRHKRKYRFAKMNGFPFVIVYKIDKQMVLVNAVFHTSRNPEVF